jgi:hypothetical protein
MYKPNFYTVKPVLIEPWVIQNYVETKLLYSETCLKRALGNAELCINQTFIQ